MEARGGKGGARAQRRSWKIARRGHPPPSATGCWRGVSSSPSWPLRSSRWASLVTRTAQAARAVWAVLVRPATSCPGQDELVLAAEGGAQDRGQLAHQAGFDGASATAVWVVHCGHQHVGVHYDP